MQVMHQTKGVILNTIKNWTLKINKHKGWGEHLKKNYCWQNCHNKFTQIVWVKYFNLTTWPWWAYYQPVFNPPQTSLIEPDSVSDLVWHQFLFQSVTIAELRSGEFAQLGKNWPLSHFETGWAVWQVWHWHTHESLWPWLKWEGWNTITTKPLKCQFWNVLSMTWTHCNVSSWPPMLQLSWQKQCLAHKNRWDFFNKCKLIHLIWVTKSFRFQLQSRPKFALHSTPDFQSIHSFHCWQFSS